MKKILFVLLLALMACAFVFANGGKEDSEKSLVWVWYPNESAPEYAESRAEIIRIASETLGKEITEQLTTDYAVAIEALVSGNAAFSWFGGEGYVQAHAKNAAVLPLVTNSPSDTLANAKYYSMLGCLLENAGQYKVGGKFDLSTLKGKRFSFVSNSSTSGFRVPSSVISKQFNVGSEDLLESGPVFSEVMFGGSHQGSFFNVLTGKADIGAFCNECIYNYVDWSQANYEDPVPGDIITVLPASRNEAPFDQVPGVKVQLVATVPVLNAPFVINTDLLTDEEIKALEAVYCSDETMNNKLIFAPKEGGVKSPFREGARFLPVTDDWYDPIRKLSGLK